MKKKLFCVLEAQMLLTVLAVIFWRLSSDVQFSKYYIWNLKIIFASKGLKYIFK